MNKKILTSLILSACISCSFATNTTFANEQISEENAIVATTNQNIPDYMVKITTIPEVTFSKIIFTIWQFFYIITAKIWNMCRNSY